MNRSLIAIAALVAISTACNTTVDVQGVDVSMAGAEETFAYVGNTSASYDLDGDGTDDISISDLVVVITDDDDLCSRISAASDLAQLDDVSAFALMIRASGSLDLTTLSSNSSLGDMYLDHHSGQVWAAGRLIERQGGVTLVDAYSDSALGEAGSDEVTLDISGISSSSGRFVSMDAGFIAELSMDLADPEAFDADWDDNGEPDYASIRAEIEGQFYGAERCDALVE